MVDRSNLKTILVPWNFSRTSKFALLKAQSIAAESTRIRVVHVAAPLTSGEYGMIELMNHLDCPYHQQFKSQHPLFSNDKRIRFETEYGLVGRELIRAAKSIDPDLIVVAMREKPRFVRMLFGDVVAQLKSKTSCPVMVMKIRPEQNSQRNGATQFHTLFGEPMST